MMHPEIEKFWDSKGGASSTEDSDQLFIEIPSTDPDFPEDYELCLVSESFKERRVYYMPPDEYTWYSEEEFLKLLKLKAFI